MCFGIVYMCGIEVRASIVFMTKDDELAQNHDVLAAS